MRSCSQEIAQPCPGCGSTESMASLRGRGFKHGCCPDRRGAPTFVEGFERVPDRPCPLGEACGLCSTHVKATGERCCDFCDKPVEDTEERSEDARVVALVLSLCEALDVIERNAFIALSRDSEQARIVALQSILDIARKSLAEWRGEPISPTAENGGCDHQKMDCGGVMVCVICEEPS